MFSKGPTSQHHRLEGPIGLWGMQAFSPVQQGCSPVQAFLTRTQAFSCLCGEQAENSRDPTVC